MPRHPRWIAAAALVFVMCVQGAAGVHGSSQSPAPSAPAPAGIAAIEVYKGTWKVSSVTLDTPHSKAGKDEKTLRNDCWRSAGYYACNQFVDGKSQVLIVYTYNPDRNRYTTYIVPQDGSPASSGTLQIQGDTWIYPWEVTDKGTTVYHRVVNIVKSPNSIQFRSEFSTDKTNWTPTMTGSEVRVSAE
jgi:hypothetical protein